MSSPSVLRKSYAEAERFVRSGIKGGCGHDSTMQPFMLPVLESVGEMGADTALVDTLLERVPLPPELQRVYRVIGSIQSEYVFNGWILMSLHKVVDMYESSLGRSQSRAADFAFIYAGMGHAVVCAYDSDLGRIYYRVDGGANDWDRQHNRDRNLGFTPTHANSHDVRDWFTRVKHWKEDDDPFTLPIVAK